MLSKARIAFDESFMDVEVLLKLQGERVVGDDLAWKC